MRRRFAYCFEGGGGYPAMLDGRLLGDAIEIGSVVVRSVDQPHGGATSTGFRFDAGGHSIAYTTDCNLLTDEMAELFANVDVWIVDALRRRPHPSHVHLDLALEWIARVRPARAILTHMDSSLNYATLLDELPAGVEPGYDGLEVEL
jgi:phosphoribosyl 1,2-cyclic phosphate phosphodiesterase